MIRREILFPDKDKEKKLKPLKAARNSFTDLKSLKGVPSGKHSPQASPHFTPATRSLSSGHSPHTKMARLPESFPTGASAYQLKSEIGQGATAKVWRAYCHPLQEECAIKIVDLESAGKNLDTIIHEAQLLCGLRHPNVLSLLSCFVEGENLWMVLPYIPGGSVESAMNYAFPKGLEERVIAPIMLQVLKALDYLHKHSIVHRDVKASNILLERDNVVLGDFGIAANIERRLDHCSKKDFGRYLSRTTFVGTPVWMAPEVIEQACGHGVKADIYSFGMTILELAIGKAPYAGMPFEVVAMNKLHHASPSLPTQHDGRSFSADMQDVVALCLEKEPSKRPTAAALLKHRFFKWTRSPRDAVEEILRGVPGPVQRLTSLVRRSRENVSGGEDEFNAFSAAADEQVSWGSLKNKDAQQALQRFDVDSALQLLHKMLQSSGVIIMPNTGSPDSTNSVLPVTPKHGSLSKNGSLTPRKSSFSKRFKSFARGNQWPNLPASALQHCTAVLFASAGRKGFGLQTTWGNGFIMARKTCGNGKSCWSGPCHVYISGTMHLGVGDSTRESIVLYANEEPLEKLRDASVFKLSGLKFMDAVEDNLDAAAICNILKSKPSPHHGVAFRHYTGTKAWKAHGIVHIDTAANERVYGKPVSVEDIFKWKVPPPPAFKPLIDVLISCEDGSYERMSSDGDSDSSFHLRPLSTFPLGMDSKHGSLSRSGPMSLSSNGLDTAFSGSFSSSVGASPRGNIPNASNDILMSAVPEHDTLGGAVECLEMPMRSSASAPLLLDQLQQLQLQQEAMAQNGNMREESKRLIPPQSAFEGQDFEVVVRSRHNDSALDLAALDSGGVECSASELSDAHSAKVGEVEVSQLVGRSSDGTLRSPTRSSDSDQPAISSASLGGGGVGPISPFARTLGLLDGGFSGEQRLVDLEDSRGSALGKSGRSDAGWRPPRPPRAPSGTKDSLATANKCAKLCTQ